MKQFGARADMADLAGRTDRAAASASRIAYLESVRGLATMQVLLLHLFSAFAPNLVFALPAGAPLAGIIHLSPLFFLYDGYSAVYIFFVLSGYVLTRSFARGPLDPLAQIVARIARLGLPAIAAASFAAAIMLIFGRANVAAGQVDGAAWLAHQWQTELSLLQVIRDGTINALFLGYRGMPGVAFLGPWQDAIEQSLVAPLWTLSIEFYGSMIMLALCWLARRSPALWWLFLILGSLFTLRSAYICFFVGHWLASFVSAEKPAPARGLLPGFAVIAGVFLCVLAEVWQPEWLKAICASPTYLMFPGQFAPLQQKTFGAILVLAGLMHLDGARSLLSTPWLVARARLSFPLYLVHWPILLGPVAILFVQSAGTIGILPARLCAIAAGIGLSVAASLLFLPIDRLALDLSRTLRGRRPAPLPRASSASAIAAE
jgi:peptidoglycan/LPS O-acetylase OafA/YrhL